VLRKEVDQMRAQIREFVVASLRDMNYDVEGLDDDTTLGPAGVDLESLALADLAVRVEDEFGVKFADDESEQLALMTVGEFTATVAERVTQLNGAGQPG
jgi:acyl carrier protein